MYIPYDIDNRGVGVGQVLDLVTPASWIRTSSFLQGHSSDRDYTPLPSSIFSYRRVERFRLSS